MSPSRVRRAAASQKSDDKCWSSFPPEDIVTFTTMSEKALLYHEGDFCHKILSMAEANGFQEQELQDLLLRELMSEGKLTYPVVQKINGQLVTTIITKHGPVCFMVTTTKAALHPENETRMLSLEIDDSEEQTRRVLKKLAQTTGKNMKPDDSIHYNWQDFQRLLRIVGPKNIAVPFADALADLIPPRATRLRRDFSLSSISSDSMRVSFSGCSAALVVVTMKQTGPCLVMTCVTN